MPDDVDDDAAVATKPVAAPDNARAVEEIIEIMSAEAEALLTDSSDSSDALLADVNLRLGMFMWDVLEDAEASARHFELADKHPLTPYFVLAHAVSSEQPGQVDSAQAVIEAAVEAKTFDDAAMAMLELSETWLYRLDNPRRATDVAAVGLELAKGRGDQALRYVARVARAVSEDWDELAQELADQAADGGTVAVVEEAAHLLADRLAESERAAELVAKNGTLLAGSTGPDAVVAYAALGLACELTDHDELEALLRHRLTLLATDDAAKREAAVVAYEVAERAGDDAEELLGVLAGDDGGTWGARLAATRRLAIARAAGDWQRVADQLRSLAKRKGAGKFAGAYLRRAAEILDAHVNQPEAAVGVWTEILRIAPPDEQVLRAVEAALLRSDPDALLAHFQQAAKAAPDRRSALLRRAAIIAESRAGDLATAIRLRKESLGDGPTAGDLLDIVRLHRRARDRRQLADAYRALVPLRKQPREASALLCAIGALELSRGRSTEAEEAFAEAAKKAPKDPSARIALVALYRRLARWNELSRALAQLAPLLVNEDSRVQAYRELGSVCAERLKDGRRAREALDKALQIDPNDPSTLHTLATLHDGPGEWAKAVEFRARAVNASDDDALRVVWSMEIGQLEEKRQKSDERALDAYRTAFEIDSTCVEALRAQADIYGRLKRHDELLGVLRAELDLVDDGARRLSVQLEIASLSRDEEDSDAAVDAYRAALELEPDNERALRGVKELAQAKGRWDVVADAFRAASPTADNLGVLAEALREREEWAELAQVLAKQIDAVPGNADKAQLSHDLAELHETQLTDVSSAIDAYQRALAFEPARPGSQAAVARLLEQEERWPELATAFEQELTTVPPEQTERQIGLLLRLGELRRDRLAKPAEAALSYEAVLERQLQHIPALEALHGLYERLGREKDLLRVLEGRAVATDDPMEQTELFTRIAQVQEKRGDLGAAIDAYREAFKTEPTNRDSFTALEKLCYKSERWVDAMELYSIAIELVEGKGSRAYRLGDLYARRGQIQLQYLHELGEAAASYLRVIELDPDNDTAMKFLESIFSQQGDWRGLIGAYEKRATLTRDDDRRLDTLRRAARVAGAKLKDPPEAARIYELILKADPSDRESQDALERFHERAGDWNKLVDVLKIRLSTAPAGDAATAMLKRIAQICEEGLRDEQRAIEHYLRILEIAPGNKEALEALGRIYESTELWTEFIDVTRRQIRVTTDRNVKALLYFKCGSVMEAKFDKQEDAIRYYDAAIKTSPSCLPAVHGLRDLYRRREDWPRVIQTLELEVKLWQDDKERAGVFAQIGRIYSIQLVEPDRAMHYFESALAVDPECLPANRALFEHYFVQRDWNRAQPLAQALAQKAMREGDPSQRSEFYRKRGIVSQMTGDPRGASESLIIALEIKPMNIEALDGLGLLAKASPDAYDFTATYRELEKIYKRRDDAPAYLGRVRVAQAVMKERDGDLDAAEKLYAEANELSPGDFTILSALVDLHENMRRWTHAIDALVRFLESDPAPSDEARIAALMRQAEIHGVCEMDPHRAASVLREVIRLQPDHEEAPYRLAQELYLLNRFGEAKQAIERVIQLAAAPGTDVQPERLARYYYYLGRIIDTSGDPRGATSKYRRAAEYDPGYAPPVLALAGRAAEAGDQRQAETLLINAAHAAMESGGAEAAVPLQRGLARILLQSGDRPAAIEAYRGILAVEPDGASDRVALAEIYAVDDLPKAIAELKKVIERDIHHAPAYRLLASFYSRTSEPDRAARVLSALQILGFAEEADRGAAAAARAQQQHVPLRQEIGDDLREQLLRTPVGASSLGQIFDAAAAEISGLFAPPPTGDNLVPVQAIEDPSLKVALADMVRLFGIEPEVFIGDHVPSRMVVLVHPRPLIVIDRSLLTEVDAARRFMFGYAFDGIRGGYALLFALGARHRTELGSLMRSMILPESERAGPTNDFINSLPRKASSLIERYAGGKQDIDFEEWLDGMLATAKRAGLFACDDFDAATRMFARLSGEDLGVDEESTTALGAVLGGADLVRFYLSDEYSRLREILSAPMAPAGTPL